jgi:hypothetical protein
MCYLTDAGESRAGRLGAVGAFGCGAWQLQERANGEFSANSDNFEDLFAYPSLPPGGHVAAPQQTWTKFESALQVVGLFRSICKMWD